MRHSPATPKRITLSPPTTPPGCSIEQSPQSPTRRRPHLMSRPSQCESPKTGLFRFGNGSNASLQRPPTPPEDDPVISLNNDLKVLASIYTDVHIDILREILLRFDGDSRLPLCTEQLIKYKKEWTKGRLLNPPRDSENDVPMDELFRSKSYTTTSKQTLTTEFKTLNKSAIDAVLAEVNHSYSKARPLLQGISAKSWRATFSSLFKKKKSPDETPSFLVHKHNHEQVLHRTGDEELDEELEGLFFEGRRRQRQKSQEAADNQLATTLNQKEAEEAKALFECQVCYDDVPFEFISTCTADAHTICRSCIRHTLSEALFGQNWAKSIDIEHGTLRCIASDNAGECLGHISSYLLQTAILSADSGYETWAKFEQRLAVDSMMKAGIPLTQCTFCHYAESPQVHTPSTAQSIKWQLRRQEVNVQLIVLFLLAEFLLPSVLLVLVLTALVSPGLPQQIFNTSLINAWQLTQTKRFRCRNPICARSSCLSCSKSWHDPHTCHEPLILSLRTAVEAARTAALKRTCPRCGTSFIKSSGCNKLVCVCGYAMCYLCRKNIGKTNESGAVDDTEGGEGYRHFCEHFRPTPGQKCTECNKCDLYMNEDEEIAVKKAGEEAEKQWREREGMVGVKGLGLEEAVGSMGKLGKEDVFATAWEKFVTGKWTVQGVCDWGVNKFIIIEN